MDIIIKGMKMPKDGVYWCEIGVAGEIATITIHGEDRKSFHLIPVPPHGRLIDADAYEKLLRGLGNRDYRREAGTLQDAIKFLHPHYAPTIIQASEEGK